MTASPQVVFGAGHVHITQIKDALGNTLTPPQVIAAPAVTNVSADFGKADVKTMTGQKEFAIHAAQGKKSTEVSFECGELYVQMLNNLYFGQTVTAGSHSIFRDTVGSIMPDSYSRTYKINSKIGINLGAYIDTTSVIQEIGTVTLTVGALTSKGATYKVTDKGVYTFDSGKVGLKMTIVYTVQNSAGATTSVSAVIVVPGSLTFDIADIQSVSVLKVGNTTYTKDAYTGTYNPASNHYAVSPDGLVILDATATGTTAINAKIANPGGNKVPVTAFLTISTLPAATTNVIIDPPANATFKADAGVTLAGVAMTKVTTLAATGDYKVDETSGTYQFFSADNNKTVIISYTTNVVYWPINPPNSGTFISDKGVRNSQGKPLTRVSSGTSLLPGQYAVTATGSYYFDDAAFSDKLYIDYEYSSSEGATLVMQNNDMGSTPLVSIDISGRAEGQEWLIQYPKAVPKAFGFATKLDDFGTYKITYEVIADRVSGEVGTVYMTA